jgi:predicted phosphodiesterase
MQLPEPVRILSDVHFHHPASFAREARQLAPLLEGVRTVIFNGDTTELRFTKLRDLGLRSCEQLRALCAERGIEPIFVNGNHDPILSPMNLLDLSAGAVFVTHGDVLYQDISPWSDESPVLRAAHMAELAKLPSEAFGDLEKRLSAVKQACMVFESHRSTLKSGMAGMIQSYAREAWPPWRPLKIINAWRQLPRRAVALGRVFRPQARYIIVGHTHYAGVWRRGPRTIINTGSFMPHGGSYLVDLQDSQLSVRRINRHAHEFHPGKTIAQLPITKLALQEGY